MNRFPKTRYILKRTAALFIIAVMLISQGCSNGSTSPDTDEPQETAVYTPQSGGTLRLPMPENAKMNTPYIVNTEEMLNLFSLVYEGLLEIDNTGRLNPALAESWSRAEDNSNTWTLNLRKNAVFHTGAQITAYDVVYSYGTLYGHVTGDWSRRDSQDVPVTDAPETTDPLDEQPVDDEPAWSDNDVSEPIDNGTDYDEPDETEPGDEPDGDTEEAFFDIEGVFRLTDGLDLPVVTPPDNDPDPDPDDPDIPDDPTPDEPSVTDIPNPDPDDTDDPNEPDETDDPSEPYEPVTQAPGLPGNPQPTAYAPTEPPAPTYQPIAADASYYAYNIAQIDSMRAVDQYTVSVTMKSGGLSALYALTFPIIPYGAQAASETEILPGTGPYSVASSSSDSVALVVNTSWWKQTPYITNIVFEARVNNDTALASYEAGQLNMVPTSLLSVGKYRKEGETNVLDVMTQEAELMLFNYSNPLFSDITLRQAIDYAIDASRIASNIFMNRAHISDVPVPPDSWFYNTESNIYEYNPGRAEEMLKNAGYIDRDGDGVLESASGKKLSFTLLTNSSSDNTTRRSLAELIASQLIQCGIEINIVTAPYYMDEAQSDSEFIKRLNEGEYDLALVGVNLSRDGDLTALLSPGGKLNYGGMSFPEILEAAEAILTAEDESAMREASFAFQTEFVDRLPFITLCFRQNSIVYSADIHGVENLREPDLLKNGIGNFFMNHS